ncbi:MAG: amidohydrolase family protein [Chloroflexi bacterium]|nr:amidohydrolase family protein [Chloroflexota bacterium]
MIIDAHTHVFPPDLIERRAELLRDEPAFREVYADPAAKLATADDVLAVVEAGELDAAVICNFAWTDLDRIRETNDYVLDAARRSGGRLIPFCMVQGAGGEAHVRGEMERVALAGARGVGELRPEQQGYSLASGRAPSLLAWGSSAYDLQLLIHVTEPVGHRYPGKPGAPMAAFAQFLNHHPEAQVIGAHWAGGLPFYALMPEVRDDLDRVHVDTAAGGLLYDDAVFRIVGEVLGYDAILFASDYPLRDPAAEIARVRGLGLDAEAEAAILGGNLQRLLHLEARAGD